jgi:hypothetical protein
MFDRAQYAPGPASAAQVRKDGDKWTAAGWDICFDVRRRAAIGPNWLPRAAQES